MRRSWALPPIAVLALVIMQFAGPVPGGVDPVALSAATAAAGWNCVLPHRVRPRSRAVRGPVGLRVTAEAPPPGAPPGAASAGAAPGGVGFVQPIAGLGTGAGQDPRAQITGSLTGASDTDSFAVPLRAGDVLGVSVQGGANHLELRDPGNVLREGSSSDRSVSYPTSSPLPGGGNATLDHVAAVTGTHVLTISGGTGQYQATVAIFHQNSAPQRIYLEFRGASVDTTIFGVDSGGTQPRTMTPLAAFLPQWGLSSADEPALIQAITQTVSANLGATGGPVRVDNSSTNPDEFGQPNVSRLVIGGTQQEAGIDTVGISQSVDPGNFAREETALVLLDTLAAPSSNPASLNHFIGAGSDRVRFVGHAIGDIASHEAGHFLGSWHTDPDNGTHDIMDSGDLAGAYGYGPDGIGGTADDTTPRFGQDVFNPSEGYTGLEDTRARTATGLGGAAAAG
jgi:hypothetical protein